jgi:hypothetical protein
MIWEMILNRKESKPPQNKSFSFLPRAPAVLSAGAPASIRANGISGWW